MLGFIVRDNGDITYREWAPNAVDVHLIGDFSGSKLLGVTVDLDKGMKVR